MIKINLRAEGKRPVIARRAKAAPKLGIPVQDIGQWLLVIGVVVGLLVVGGWWYMLQRTIDRKNAEIDENQREVDKLALVIKEVDEYKAKKAELERKIAVITGLKENQQGPVKIMDQVSRALPELLWLNSMQVTGGTISVKGEAFNPTAIANFMDNLDRVPEFQEPILKDTTRKGATYDFQISFGYSLAKPAPAAAAPPGTPAAPGAPAATGASPPAANKA